MSYAQFSQHMVDVRDNVCRLQSQRCAPDLVSSVASESAFRQRVVSTHSLRSHSVKNKNDQMSGGRVNR